RIVMKQAEAVVSKGESVTTVGCRQDVRIMLGMTERSRDATPPQIPGRRRRQRHRCEPWMCESIDRRTQTCARLLEQVVSKALERVGCRRLGGHRCPTIGA